MQNKKYDWSQFTMKAAIKASPEKVFKAWTDEKILCKWFLIKAKMELRRGGNFMWEWFGNVQEKGIILEVKKPNRLSMTFAGCVLDINIKKDKRGTFMTLHQHHIPLDDKNKAGTHLSCFGGWTFFITNLKSYLENGIDLREKDVKYIKKGTVFY